MQAVPALAALASRSDIGLAPANRAARPRRQAPDLGTRHVQPHPEQVRRYSAASQKGLIA